METMLDYIKQTPDTLNNIINNSYDYTKLLVDFYKENDIEITMNNYRKLFNRL